MLLNLSWPQFPYLHNGQPCLPLRASLNIKRAECMRSPKYSAWQGLINVFLEK